MRIETWPWWLRKDRTMDRAASVKHDQGKPDWTLFPFNGAEEVVRVLEFGAKKYSRDNWKQTALTGDEHAVAQFEKRLLAAAMRHMADVVEGEECDKDSGLMAAGHAACDLLMYIWSKKIWQKRQERLGKNGPDTDMAGHALDLSRPKSSRPGTKNKKKRAVHKNNNRGGLR